MYLIYLKTAVYEASQKNGISAAELTFAQLQKTPGIGKMAELLGSRLGEVRQWRIKDFRDYLIFYRIQDGSVEILRVFHGARDLADIVSKLDEQL